MEPSLPPDMHTRAGTVGGLLLVLITQINSSDMLRTAILAVIGGGVSFGVSMALRYMVKVIKHHRK